MSKAWRKITCSSGFPVILDIILFSFIFSYSISLICNPISVACQMGESTYYTFEERMEKSCIPEVCEFAARVSPAKVALACQ
jgi:hypothetical protein